MFLVLTLTCMSLKRVKNYRITQSRSCSWYNLHIAEGGPLVVQPRTAWPPSRTWGSELASNTNTLTEHLIQTARKINKECSRKELLKNQSGGKSESRIKYSPMKENGRSPNRRWNGNCYRGARQIYRENMNYYSWLENTTEILLATSLQK